MNHLDEIARVASPNHVRSPVSGLIAALVQIELHDDSGALGTLVFGDILRLELADGRRFDVVARRVALRFDGDRSEPVVVDAAPPEIVPLLLRARRGPVVQRERRLLHGDRVRLRAVAEGETLRDDLAPIVLEAVPPGR